MALLLISFDQDSTELPYRNENFIAIHSQFGKQPLPINFKPFHYSGVQVSLREDAIVMSVDDGKVVSSCQNCERGIGNFIKIQHNDSTVITYYHLSEVGIKDDEEVIKGQEIGTSGNSGLTTMSNGFGLSVFVNDLPVDPAVYLSITRKEQD